MTPSAARGKFLAACSNAHTFLKVQTALLLLAVSEPIAPGQPAEVGQARDKIRELLTGAAPEICIKRDLVRTACQDPAPPSPASPTADATSGAPAEQESASQDPVILDSAAS